MEESKAFGVNMVTKYIKISFSVLYRIFLGVITFFLLISFVNTIGTLGLSFESIMTYYNGLYFRFWGALIFATLLIELVLNSNINNRNKYIWFGLFLLLNIFIFPFFFFMYVIKDKW